MADLYQTYTNILLYIEDELLIILQRSKSLIFTRLQTIHSPFQTKRQVLYILIRMGDRLRFHPLAVEGMVQTLPLAQPELMTWEPHS